MLSPDDKEDPEQTFMEEFQDTGRFKILLSHMPEGLLLWKSIHSHILPGLDDGAESLEESLVMARLAVSSGTRHMAATSHGNYYDYTLEEYRESLSFQ